MQRPIGFWLKLVDRLIDEGFDALLRDRQLNRRHWQVLNELSKQPATVADLDRRLAPFLGAGEPTTRPVLDDLASRSWLAWTVGDRAAVTPQGVDAHAGLHPAAAAHRDRVAAGISGEEYAATLDVLRRMAENLGWVDHPRRPD
ncbi:MAG: winged helix-turn-helix transcriptional regulator [Geodermatophilaceae bacterium]|nr:winged helix-turn-helix transcriptional regulator [Geodermatophilaceae bacterium]